MEIRTPLLEWVSRMRRQACGRRAQTLDSFVVCSHRPMSIQRSRYKDAEIGQDRCDLSRARTDRAGDRQTSPVLSLLRPNRSQPSKLCPLGSDHLITAQSSAAYMDPNVLHYFRSDGHGSIAHLNRPPHDDVEHAAGILIYLSASFCREEAVLISASAPFK